MKYYLDTEFNERRGRIDLISIGIVREDGKEFCAESCEFYEDECNDWVRANVIPKLGPYGNRMSRDRIASMVREFVGTDAPEFWGYYADYDWVVFCWLFGSMIDLPNGWPMYCRDLKQLSDHLGAPKFEGPKGEHNALVDAKWNMAMHAYLSAYEDQSARRDP